MWKTPIFTKMEQKNSPQLSTGKNNVLIRIGFINIYKQFIKRLSTEIVDKIHEKIKLENLNKFFWEILTSCVFFKSLLYAFYGFGYIFVGFYRLFYFFVGMKNRCMVSSAKLIPYLRQ